MRTNLFFNILVFFVGLCNAQAPASVFFEQKNDITIEINNKDSLLLPLEISIQKTKKGEFRGTTTPYSEGFQGFVTLEINNTNNIKNESIKILERTANGIPIFFDKNRGDKFYTFSVRIRPKPFKDTRNPGSIVFITKLFNELNECIDTSTLSVNIRSKSDEIFSLREYNQNVALQLGNVRKVEQLGNLINLTGSVDNQGAGTTQRSIYINPGNAYEIKKYRGIRLKGTKKVKDYFKEVDIALTTIPFRFRPSVQRVDSIENSNGTTIVQSTMNITNQGFSGVNNLGVNFTFASWDKKKYSYNGKNKTTSNSFGFFIAPLVTSLNKNNTNLDEYDLGDQTVSKMFLSSALTYTRSINSVNLNLGIGIDFGFGEISESWIYNKEPWIGFGVGIDVKAISSLFN